MRGGLVLPAVPREVGPELPALVTIGPAGPRGEPRLIVAFQSGGTSALRIFDPGRLDRPLDELIFRGGTSFVAIAELDGDPPAEWAAGRRRTRVYGLEPAPAAITGCQTESSGGSLEGAERVEALARILAAAGHPAEATLLLEHGAASGGGRGRARLLGIRARSIEASAGATADAVLGALRLARDAAEDAPQRVRRTGDVLRWLLSEGRADEAGREIRAVLEAGALPDETRAMARDATDLAGPPIPATWSLLDERPSARGPARGAPPLVRGAAFFDIRSDELWFRLPSGRDFETALPIAGGGSVAVEGTLVVEALEYGAGLEIGIRRGAPGEAAPEEAYVTLGSGNAVSDLRVVGTAGATRGTLHVRRDWMEHVGAPSKLPALRFEIVHLVALGAARVRLSALPPLPDEPGSLEGAGQGRPGAPPLPRTVIDAWVTELPRSERGRATLFVRSRPGLIEPETLWWCRGRVREVAVRRRRGWAPEAAEGDEGAGERALRRAEALFAAGRLDEAAALAARLPGTGAGAPEAALFPGLLAAFGRPAEDRTRTAALDEVARRAAADSALRDEIRALARIDADRYAPLLACLDARTRARDLFFHAFADLWAHPDRLAEAETIEKRALALVPEEASAALTALASRAAAFEQAGRPREALDAYAALEARLDRQGGRLEPPRDRLYVRLAIIRNALRVREFEIAERWARALLEEPTPEVDPCALRDRIRLLPLPPGLRDALAPALRDPWRHAGGG